MACIFGIDFLDGGFRLHNDGFDEQAIKLPSGFKESSVVVGGTGVLFLDNLLEVILWPR